MNEQKIICGIQQMGIGVPNVQEIWKWYRKMFGVNVRIFEEAAEAPLMTRYTGGKVHSRTATLALSMEGGGGFEIWQFTSRNTEKASFRIQAGDFGLYICKIKSRDVASSHSYHQAAGAHVSPIFTMPDRSKGYFITDPNDNIFQIVEGKGWFHHTGHPSGCGGVAGCIIGVRNIDNVLDLYRKVLDYDQQIYDVTEKFEDFDELEGGNGLFRRVLLRHSRPRRGPFAALLGPTEIELIEAKDRTDCRTIFENRYWGDWGFIHLCFDVQGMDALKRSCEEAGYPFTVDSSDTFDMGEAGGRFAYIEDPDGTWIEFVETHKVPVLKKIGWYINLRKRKPGKALPRWMLRAMGLNKVKD